MALCRARPTPATFWDWIASIAPINFLPGNQELVDYFAAVKDEIASGSPTASAAVPDERYRLFFDGIMNWNKLGWLAEKFAAHDAAVVAGRYTHNAFWQEPQLIDADDPLLGMAQHYLLCPTNHGVEDHARADARGLRRLRSRRHRLPRHPHLPRVHQPADSWSRMAQKNSASRRCSSRATSPTRRSTRTRC